MDKILEKLTGLAEKLLEEIEKKPLKSILTAVFTIWIIGYAMKSIKRWR
jgi:hypothetical protein